jgi:hypothetical protein
MSIFVPAFSPAVFDWNQALKLNCLQWVSESHSDDLADNIYTALFLTSGDPLMVYPICKFGRALMSLGTPSTEFAADFLSLMFLKAPQIIERQMRVPPYFHDEAIEMASELGVFNPNVESEIRVLRLSLSRRHVKITGPFKPAFSPGTFGEKNALMLNLLQEVQEEGVSGMFTRVTGSEFEADCLSYYYCKYPAEIVSFVKGRSDFTAAFAIDGIADYLISRQIVMEIDDSLISKKIVREMDLLRVSLHSIPRSVAFVSGTHKRLGCSSPAVRALDGASDIMQMILNLSLG